MFTYQIAPGTTDVSVVIRIIDSTDGTPETGVVFNTSGIDIQYRREGAASTAITEATLAALTTAHTDGGFLHIGNGYYRLDLPDAACASGAAGALVHGTVTGMVVIGCYIQLEAAVNKVYSDTTIIYSDTTIATSKATQIYSDTAIASSKAVQVYSDTTIIYSDTTIATSKAVQIYSDTTIIYSDTTAIEAGGGSLTAAQDSKLTRVNSKATQIYSDTTIIASKSVQIYSDTTAAAAGTSPDVLVDTTIATLATQTSFTLTAGSADNDVYNGMAAIFTDASTSTQKAVAFISDYVGSTKTVTLEAAPGFTIATTDNIAIMAAGASTSSPPPAALTGAQASQLTRVNSKSTQIYSDTTIIYSDTTVATSKTTQIYSDTAIASSKAVQVYSDTTIIASKSVQVYSDTTAIHTQTTTASSKAVQIYSDTTIIYSDTTIAASKATQIYSDTTAVNSGIIYGAAATGTLSTTVATSNLTGYADDQLIGRVIIWLSGDCEGEASDITDYANTNGTLTFTALTTAPGNGDTFKIV